MGLKRNLELDFEPVCGFEVITGLTFGIDLPLFGPYIRQTGSTVFARLF